MYERLQINWVENSIFRSEAFCSIIERMWIKNMQNLIPLFLFHILSTLYENKLFECWGDKPQSLNYRMFQNWTHTYFNIQVKWKGHKWKALFVDHWTFLKPFILLTIPLCLCANPMRVPATHWTDRNQYFIKGSSKYAVSQHFNTWLC
jgi:hypothetical protein